MPKKKAPPMEASRRAEMLTDAEKEALRREAKETSAYLKKAFAHLKPLTRDTTRSLDGGHEQQHQGLCPKGNNPNRLPRSSSRSS